MNKRRIDAMQKYDDRKRRRVCVKCEAPAEEGILRCRPCANKNSANGAAYYRRKRALRLDHMRWYRNDHFLRGLCIACPRKAKKGCVHCEKCLARARKWYADRKVRLGLPAPRAVTPKSDGPRWVSLKPAAPVVPEYTPEPACLECGQNPPMRDQAICWCCANPPAPRVERPTHARTHVAQR